MYLLSKPAKIVVFALFSALAMTVLCAPMYASTPVEKLIQLQLGDVHVIDARDLADVVVGNESMVSVQTINDDTLVIKALRVGETELLLKHKLQRELTRVRINISPLHQSSEQIQLAWIAEHMPELSISQHEHIVLISGALSARNYQHLQQQAEQHPHWLLQIDVEPEPPGRMIELEVKILEVKRQYAQQLGIRWPGSISGPQLSDTADSWITMPVAIQTTLNLLEQNGHARVLAEPKLIALSGEQADFLVGGEFPIPQVVGQGLQDVTFREYGIALSMSPRDMGEQGIATAIKAEISTIDPATSVNGVPGMLTRRVSSSITAVSGELIVLSGLLSQEQSKQADLFPYLNTLPILGNLFSSKQFRTAETELLVIVSPQFKQHREQAQRRVEGALSDVAKFHEMVSCVGLIDAI